MQQTITQAEYDALSSTDQALYEELTTGSGTWTLIPTPTPTGFELLMDARAKMDAARNSAKGDAVAIEAADESVAQREADLTSARDVAIAARAAKQAHRDSIIEACDATDAATMAIRAEYSGD